MPYTEYLKSRALHFRSGGKSLGVVVKEEGLSATRHGLWKFFCKYDSTGVTARLRGSRRQTKLTPEVLTARNHPLSLSIILRCRKTLGWTFGGSTYCQLIRTANKTKRLNFAIEYAHEADSGFNDMARRPSNWRATADASKVNLPREN